MTAQSPDADHRPAPAIYSKLVGGYAVGTGIYYAAVTPLNFTLIPTAIYPMLACTSLSAAMCLVAWWWVCRRPGGSMTRLELAAALMNLVLLGNVVLHTFLVRDAHLLIYFAPIALVFGVIGPSYRVVFPSLAATAICAMICGHFMPQAYRSEFDMAVGTIMFVAVGATLLLHGAIRQKAAALIQLEATAAALDTARQRSEILAQEARAAHAAKARFIANMSHEIRNPLGGMLGLAAALARTDLTPDQAQTVALLESSGRMLNRIVSDVLDMEKIEAGKVELELLPVSLRDEIAGVVRLMEGQAREKGLSLALDAPEAEAAIVTADPTRIKQIAVNLVSNAIKFTHTGGVSVRLRTAALDDAAGVLATIEVIDTGIGFDAANAPWLFDRFGQADASTTRRFGGAGLGLSISRGLARQMGGDIAAVSAPGQGSCFTVSLTLPLAAPAGFAAPAPDCRPVRRDLRVLVAEDSAAVQRVIALLLDQVTAQVTIVDNGHAAVEGRRLGDFDVILMDMHMPELGGLEATRAIREIERAADLPATPIVMLTGSSGDDDRAGARAAGADHYVTKPIDPDALFAALDAVLARRSKAA